MASTVVSFDFDKLSMRMEFQISTISLHCKFVEFKSSEHTEISQLFRLSCIFSPEGVFVWESNLPFLHRHQMML